MKTLWAAPFLLFLREFLLFALVLLAHTWPVTQNHRPGIRRIVSHTLWRPLAGVRARNLLAYQTSTSVADWLALLSLQRTEPNRTEPNRASSTQLEPTQTERLTSRTAAYIFYTGLSGPGSDKPAACNRIKCSTDSDMRRLCSRVAQACPFQSVIRTGSVVFIQSLRTASIR